ncbi:PREDICTED: F-box only protein 28 isoform X2 [Dinoponera quadriceps]|uniref:F-box only protein 28 isoform X2 n=1 Tax=Dinoponera quadriceps TaxID=609295 RepID=A0A6P3XRJ8_DINQU|nr:PREDICTED: F-box only protein 28 isoform X2 [Dinoponera quadriceps]
MEWKGLQADMTHKHRQQNGFPVTQQSNDCYSSIIIHLDDDSTWNLIDLPDVVLETILSNLTYDEISKNRIVCKQFDRTCKKLLNRGFNLMEKYHAQCLRAVKSKLPRRESERRSHPLARHCDILTAIETRISMLSMTFSKLIRDTKTPPRAHEILQELRDISSMAMEHFDEKILPDLKHNICMVGTVNSYELPGGALMISHTRHPNNATLPHNFTSEKLNQSFKKIYDRTKQNKISCLTMKNLMGRIKLKVMRQGMQIRLQSSKLQKQAQKLHEQDVLLAEMRKHLEEWEQKMVDLTAELSRAREGTQNPDSLESRKHIAISKHIDIINTEVDATLQSNELHSKKRKLIVERKSSSDAQDIKFKKFMSDLLATNTLDSGHPSTSSNSTFLH